MSKTIRYRVDFTQATLQAAFKAVSNYKPSDDPDWRQAAQANAAKAISKSIKVEKGTS